MDQRFHDCHWGQCFELLSHLCEYSDSILLVSGPRGSGKTTMKQELIEHEADHFIICEINACTTLTSEQLTNYIEEDLDPHDSREMLLLVDDAQNLNLDVIAVIFQLNQKSNGDGKLHIVLFATDDFEQKVSRSVLKEDFAQQVHTIEIEPLTVPEVESFLIQQWRLQHHDTEMPLNRAKCEKIHAITGGVLGKVQETATEMFAGKKIKEESGYSLSPVAVGVTVSFGVIFCILAVLWPVADKDIINKTTSTTEALTIAQHDDAAKSLEIANLSPQATSEIETRIAAEQTIPTINQALNAPVIETAAVNTALEMQSQVNRSEHVEQKIAALEKKIDELQKQVNHDQKALRAAESKLMQLTAPKRNEIKSVKKSLNLSKFEQRILSLPGSHYTLQLISMHNEGQAQNFIRKNKLSNRAQYYKANFKGRDWFVVVYGNFTSKLDAQAALSGLPTHLKKLRPRMRDYGAIQYSINSRKKE